MKILLTAVFLIGIAGGANAFELQRISALDAAAEGTELSLPLPVKTADKYAGSEIEAAYSDMAQTFYSAKHDPADWDVAGDWEGRVFIKGDRGEWRTISPKISFRKMVSPADLGPLFPAYSSELYVTYPYYAATIEQRLSPVSGGMEFKFRSDREVTVTFKRFKRGQENYLSMKTDCYGGTSYGYFFRKTVSPNIPPAQSDPFN